MVSSCQTPPLISMWASSLTKPSLLMPSFSIFSYNSNHGVPITWRNSQDKQSTQIQPRLPPLPKEVQTTKEYPHPVASNNERITKDDDWPMSVLKMLRRVPSTMDFAMSSRGVYSVENESFTVSPPSNFLSRFSSTLKKIWVRFNLSRLVNNLRILTTCFLF